ncbi:hypothetical protein ACWEV3_15590 [Saccharopolyspora sp. NPDC003752]
MAHDRSESVRSSDYSRPTRAGLLLTRADEVIGKGKVDILPDLDGWLASLFTDDRIHDTVTRLAAAADDDTGRGTEHLRAAQATVRDCQRKLTRYRQALDEGSDPGVIGRWIADVEAQQVQAEAVLRRATPRRAKITPDYVEQLFTACRSAARSLHRAAPERKAPVYRALGLKVTYQKETHTAEVQVDPDPSSVGILSCPRGDLNPHAH